MKYLAILLFLAGCTPSQLCIGSCSQTNPTQEKIREANHQTP